MTMKEKVEQELRTARRGLDNTQKAISEINTKLRNGACDNDAYNMLPGQELHQITLEISRLGSKAREYGNKIEMLEYFLSDAE